MAPKPSGALSLNETSLILNATLKPEHRDDPLVIAWIAAYMNCRDVRQAAMEVGIDPRSGKNLRARPDIHLAITKLTDKSVIKYGFDATEVVERVKEISNVDPIEMERPDGSYKNKMSEIAPETRRAIKKMKVKNTYLKDPNGIPYIEGQIIEYEFHDKMKAHEMLGQEKDVFKPKSVVEHDVSSRMADVLLESAARGAIEITGRVVGEEANDKG